jgi:drug/metabolite transporter (DMT)-like permease
MNLKIMLAVFTVNSVLSQLVLRHALQGLGGASTSLAGLPRFIGRAALAPWIYVSVGLQVVSYVLWMLIVSREKLGVATATVGAGFYLLMALAGWAVYGEALSLTQWLGIALVTAGVACMTTVPT